MHEGILRIGSNEVPYRVGADCAESLAEGVERLRPGSAVVVIDEAVGAHAEPLLDVLGRRMPVHPIVIAAEEQHKRLSLVEQVLDGAVSAKADRTSAILAMGALLIAAADYVFVYRPLAAMLSTEPLPPEFAAYHHASRWINAAVAALCAVAAALAVWPGRPKEC